MCRITIINNNIKREYEVNQGRNLLEFLREIGCAVPAVCGGNGTCGKCIVYVNGEKTLACNTLIADSMKVEIPSEINSTQILSNYKTSEILTNKNGYGIAVDIGTTTVVLALIELCSGKRLKISAFENPQRSFGFDVLSRIAASNEGDLTTLSRLICDKLDSEIKSLAGSREIKEMVIAGNTTMIHLLLAKDPACLGTYPFEMQYKLQGSYDLFGIDTKILPWISAFIGGDIVSGILNLDSEETFLLADIGTNGELVLHHKGKYICTSAAAGPAFEGGNITCGMAGVSGAVCAVDSGFNITAIDNAVPIGICGSGVLDITAALLENNIIDENGTLEDEYFDDGVKISVDIVFTGKDVREVQLAKSAIRSGIEILIKTAELEYKDIEKIYLAGGFGVNMNAKHAAQIGLFPNELSEKIVPVGNTSLGGAVSALLTDKTRQIKQITDNALEINLAAHPDFNNSFMEYMGFEND